MCSDMIYLSSYSFIASDQLIYRKIYNYNLKHDIVTVSMQNRITKLMMIIYKQMLCNSISICSCDAYSVTSINNYYAD